MVPCPGRLSADRVSYVPNDMALEGWLTRDAAFRDSMTEHEYVDAWFIHKTARHYRASDGAPQSAAAYYHDHWGFACRDPLCCWFPYVCCNGRSLISLQLFHMYDECISFPWVDRRFWQRRPWEFGRGTAFPFVKCGDVVLQIDRYRSSVCTKTLPDIPYLVIESHVVSVCVELYPDHWDYRSLNINGHWDYRGQNIQLYRDNVISVERARRIARRMLFPSVRRRVDALPSGGLGSNLAYELIVKISLYLFI